MNILNLPIEITREEDTYIAKCPIIQGAFAEWETPEEALSELISVIKMIKEYRKEDIKPYQTRTTKIFTSLPILQHA